MTNLKERLSGLKMIISDVDGVLTNGSIYKGADGGEFKQFSVNDGTGFAMARAADFKLALISGRYSAATDARAAELRITDIYNGTLNKIKPYEDLKKKHALSDEEIAYLGDDLIDIPVMEKVGIPIAVENASEIVKSYAVYVTQASGGKGAFREAVDWILKAQGRYEIVLKTLRNQVLNS